MTLSCNHCQTIWAIPHNLPPEIVEVLRQTKLVTINESIVQLRVITGMGMMELKALITHIPLRPGECLSCSATLSKDKNSKAKNVVVVCAKGGALNLDVFNT
jgi:hypothetical protein